MAATAQAASQETSELSGAAETFLEAWRESVPLAGESLFGCQVRTPADATHWRQLTPKLDVMRKKLPLRSQADAVFAASMAAFFNPAEAQRLLIRVGTPELGSIATVLDARRRALLGTMLASFGGW